jgi:hypothetical protein
MQSHVAMRLSISKTSSNESRLPKIGRLPLPAPAIRDYIKGMYNVLIGAIFQTCRSKTLIVWLAYFEQIHPMYPFINRKSFEEKASSSDNESRLETNVAWSALYHGVLALGAHIHDNGQSSPGKGVPWHLFQLALSLMPKLVRPGATLLNVQV